MIKAETKKLEGMISAEKEKIWWMVIATVVDPELCKVQYMYPKNVTFTKL